MSEKICVDLPSELPGAARVFLSGCIQHLHNPAFDPTKQYLLLEGEVGGFPWEPSRVCECLFSEHEQVPEGAETVGSVMVHGRQIWVFARFLGYLSEMGRT